MSLWFGTIYIQFWLQYYGEKGKGKWFCFMYLDETCKKEKERKKENDIIFIKNFELNWLVFSQRHIQSFNISSSYQIIKKEKKKENYIYIYGFIEERKEMMFSPTFMPF